VTCKKKSLFQDLFCYAPSQIARKRTWILLGFQGSGTDRFRAVDVMVMMMIVMPALHELQMSIWKQWIYERSAKSGRHFQAQNERQSDTWDADDPERDEVCMREGEGEGEGEGGGIEWILVEGRWHL
jgi:hypothetical protein